MRIGVLAGPHRYVLPDPTGRSRILNFSIGAAGASRQVMLHSAAATPGRYLMEMARRAAAREGGVVLVNPLLELAPPEANLIVDAALRERSAMPLALVSDCDGRPLAYRLPEALVSRQARFISLLSAVDADADDALLSAWAGAPVPHARLPMSFALHGGVDGFRLDPHHRDVYAWVARRAATELAGSADRDQLPFAAVMPFHAGDLLFLLLANARAGGYFRAVVVDRRYADIARAVAPEIECIPLDFAAGRDSTTDWDPALRDLMLGETLPRGYCYSYCRPSRRYDNYPIHLIDQYAFAAGAPMIGESVSHRSPPSAGLAAGRRVLVHVDGGWPMKVYPDESRRALTAALGKAGFAVTLVSSRPVETLDGVPHVRLGGVEQLRALLLDHGMLIGMDSFPAHYAAHVLGVPTVCLFASTHPANSDAAPGPRYRALEVGLDCRPCRAVSRCPRYGGDECRNFLPPDAVAATAVNMWADIYRDLS